MKTDTREALPCDNRDRDCSAAAANHGKPRWPANQQKLRRGKEGFFSMDFKVTRPC